MADKDKQAKTTTRRRTTVNGGNGRGKTTNRLSGNAAVVSELQALTSALAVRATVAAKLGKSFGTDRDLYQALGYTKKPVYEDYVAKYKRQDVARAIIDAPVRASWRKKPIVTDGTSDESDFNEKWKEIVDSHRIFHYLARVDRLAGIGSYAVLVMGFDDNADTSQPAISARELLYLMPYAQNNVSMTLYEDNVSNRRYGLPTQYGVTMTRGNKVLPTMRVHHTRLVHVAEDTLENDLEGMPKLQAVLNRLQDLDLVAGGSAEMFWRGALPGLGFKIDDNATLGEQDLADMRDQIEDYMHGLKRYIRLHNVSVEDLSRVQVADPSNHADILLTLIASAVRIPKRILLGSERGELASSMDERNWIDTIDSRRHDHCESKILRPFVDRLIEVGVLPQPAEGYVVAWPDLFTPGEKDAAETAEIQSRAIKHYSDAALGGAAEIVPPEIFLRDVMGFDDDTIARIEDILGRIQATVGDDEPE